MSGATKEIEPRRCAICKRRVKAVKYKIVIEDYTDDRGDWQSHPIHGMCLDKLWAWAKTQRPLTNTRTEQP